MTRRTRLALIALLPALAAAAWAPGRFVRDVPHSQINFMASSRLIDAQGTWDAWDADVRFDPDAINTSSVAITIDAKSVSTRVEMRDNHLRSKDFFFADSFPKITFKSVTVNAPSGPSSDPQLADTKLLITGDLTIRGVTKRITVPSTLMFYDRAQQRSRVKGAFTVLRKDFGVGFDPPMNPVRNEVELSFDVSFQPAK